MYLFSLQAEEFKALGNAALTQGKVEEAVTFYNQAVSLDPDNHVLYSNRSAAYCKSGDYEKSLEDAEKVISLKSDWAKVSLLILIWSGRVIFFK